MKQNQRHTQTHLSEINYTRKVLQNQGCIALADETSVLSKLLFFNLLMKESELLGKLLPGHPDIFPIIQNIREKYQIPPIDPENSDITDLLITEYEIDWEAVKQDIEKQVNAISLHDDEETKYIQTLQKLRDMPLDFPELDILPEETRNGIKKVFSMFAQQSAFILDMLDNQSYRPIAEIIYEYLLTGKTREVPHDWFGKVMTTQILGAPIVMVLAGEGSNPKELAEQFKGEFTKTFGKIEYKITDTQLDTAEYLTMQLQGDSLKRLVERYRDKHPSEFPVDHTSPEFRESVAKHVDMMEKRLKRLQDVMHKLARDEN